MDQNTNGYNNGYGNDPFQNDNGNNSYNYGQSTDGNNSYNYGQSTNGNNSYNYGQSTDGNNSYNYGQSTDGNNGYNYGQSSSKNNGYNNGSNSYNYNNGNYNYQPPQQQNNSGFAVAALVFGILSLVLMCGVNIITGILGIIFGALYLAKGQQERRTMATVGLVLSIVGIVVYIIIIIIAVVVMGTGMYDAILNEMLMDTYY